MATYLTATGPLLTPCLAVTKSRDMYATLPPGFIYNTLTFPSSFPSHLLHCACVWTDVLAPIQSTLHIIKTVVIKNTSAAHFISQNNSNGRMCTLLIRCSERFLAWWAPHLVICALGTFSLPSCYDLSRVALCGDPGLKAFRRPRGSSCLCVLLLLLGRPPPGLLMQQPIMHISDVCPSLGLS